MSRRARRLAIACALLALAPAASGAQGARITGVTTARLVELRPLVDDSVPLSAAVDSSGVGGDLRRTADGTIVRCAGAPN
ncbi:MAG: hypothetical protein ACXW61_18575, partial [Gemmatirosa sp.]